jgi:hypothetical protein
MDGSEGFAMRNDQFYYSGCIAGNVPAHNRIGQAVAALDINGDGISDVAVGGPRTDSYLYGGRWMLPRAATLFGTSADGGDFKDISNPGIAGFVLEGATTPYSFHDAKYSYVGQSLASGDVTGDGIADLIVGVQDGLSYEGTVGGAVVIHGQMGGEASWPDSINYNSCGFFRLLDTTGSDTGRSSQVAFLGDVNGDGIGDFALTVPDRNAAFIVFGASGLSGDKFTSSYGDLDGSDGFRIDFPNIDYQFPVAIAGADVNKDGVNDIVIGVTAGDSGNSGTVGHVIFGKAGLGASGVIDLTTPLTTPNGFSISLPSEYYVYGYCGSLAVGDVNGDGLKDLIIGIPDDPYVSRKGRVYVIFSPKPQ